LYKYNRGLALQSSSVLESRLNRDAQKLKLYGIKVAAQRAPKKPPVEEQKKKSNRPYMKHAESPAKTNITKKPLRSLDWPQHGGTLVNVLELPAPTKKKARSINTPKNVAVNSITFL
jgi:hypothetical protein